MLNPSRSQHNKLNRVPSGGKNINNYVSEKINHDVRAEDNLDYTRASKTGGFTIHPKADRPELLEED